MSDLGPRRSMDMGRPTRPQPADPPTPATPQPASRPAIAPQPRPVAGPASQSRPVAAQRPQPLPPRPAQPALRPQPVHSADPRLATATAAPAAAPATEPEAPRRRGWLVALQFIIGLLVIAGVATAVVMLYMKYYQ